MDISQQQYSNNARISMLHKANTLTGYNLHALDGEMGKVKDFSFDDTHWAIRYLVADTGLWIKDRKVLIAPYALAEINSERRSIGVELTKKQIEESPLLATDMPVSRQFEESYYGYFGWPMYWFGSFVWGTYSYVERDHNRWGQSNKNEKPWDHHLRSTHEVRGYHIHARDGEIGHVEDFILDDESWAIRYLVVNTQNWWPGKKVLISPKWIERVSWRDSKVFINLFRDAVRHSPQYNDESVIIRTYENTLHSHYNRQGYWVDEGSAKEHASQGISKPEMAASTDRPTTIHFDSSNSLG